MSLSDEPDFEVTDLRDTPADEGAQPAARRAVDPFAVRTARTRRIIGTAISVVGILAVLGVILAGPANRLSLLRSLGLAAPPAADPSVTGSNLVYLEHGLPWGLLKLDGKTVSLAAVERPYTGKEGEYTALHLSDGTHRITYAATPFPTLNCTITVPPDSADTCPLIHSPGPQDVHPQLSGERLLDLGGEPDKLPKAQLAALTAAIARALADWNATATVARGEPILSTGNLAVAAADSLTATLLYTPSQDSLPAGPVSPSLRACPDLCSEDTAAHLYQTTDNWSIGARVSTQWVYTDAIGQAVGQSATALAGNATQGIVTVAVNWKGSWQVNLFVFGVANIPCSAALDTLAATLPPTDGSQALQVDSTDDIAQGCLLTAHNLGAPPDPMYFVYRFGVILAANVAAHKALPTLPQAGTQAVAFARSLGASIK